MPSREQTAAFVKVVEADVCVRAIEVLYAEDATMPENNERSRVGLPALIARERIFSDPK